MIWTLKVKFCHVEPECHHLIEIDADASLIDLHMAIQEAVNFDNDHLFEFFLGRHPRNRAVKIGNSGGWGDFDPYEIYEKVELSEVFPLPAKGLKLFYLFDFGDSWYFQITKTRRKEKDPEPGVTYPRVVEKKGENPEQYPE